MDAKLKSTKDIQAIIDLITISYSQEDIFSLGRNIEIDKISYFGFGMNTSQLAEAFVTRVVQINKEGELFNLIRTHKSLKRDVFNSLFEVEETIYNTDTKSILNSLHVIIIGVNDYSKVENFESLTYSSKDAQDISDFIKDKWGVNKRNIHLFNECNTTNYDEIQEAITNVITKLDECDNLLFYFSGHGDEVNENSYLILSDTVENSFNGNYENSICLRDLNELFKQCKAKIKFRIFDACRCGQSFSKGKAMTSKFKSDMFGNGNGWITLASCNVKESSIESGEMHNGIFTHFLIEGLMGAARRGEGKMLIEDLKIYVADKVPSNTKYKQNPQYHCELEGNIYIE
ncbi:caspase family protein [Clostridium estertheticum]|uniref:caspase family protein n=1 Tax=Clostridium estertheticum TaxID=238834 RepID=UPI001C0B812C|nr:caspase family protein [Clostridium estertheticum]MBU3072849.1 caspase family protein [Clostridium estertheticum]MBU3163114.1 caspase family protein [Clostridium estertheticum]